MKEIQDSKKAKQGNDRRSFIRTSAGLALGGLLPQQLWAIGNSPTLSDTDNFKAYVRLIGSLEPATTYAWFSGNLWGIMPNEAPKPLTTFQGLAKNLWTIENGALTKESFDIGFFGNLETGEVLEEFVNPYTNTRVRPFHFKYGGDNKSVYKNGTVISNGKSKIIAPKWIKAGEQVWLDENLSASFTNPFDPKEWPKASAGKDLNFGSATTYTTSAKELFDTKRSSCPYMLFWSSVNSWEPWLLMGQTPGFIMWRATGVKLFDKNEIPSQMRTYIDTYHPNYLNEGKSWKGRASTYSSYKQQRKPIIE